MTYVEKLQVWCEDQRANHGLVDIKFFPHFICLPGNPPMQITPDPLPTVEQMAEAAYKLLTGETSTRQLDVSEYDL